MATQSDQRKRLVNDVANLLTARGGPYRGAHPGIGPHTPKRGQKWKPGLPKWKPHGGAG